MTEVMSNASILGGEELEVTRGYLIVRDGIIEEIGEGVPPKRGTDLKRGFILPPFVNAHTHVADSVVKELYLGRTQAQVVGPGGEKLRVLQSSAPGEIISSIRTTLEDMLNTGTLAHCDFREGGTEGIEALRLASHGTVKSFIMGEPSVPGETDAVLNKSDGIGLSSLKAFSWDAVKSIAERTRKAKKLFSVHVAESGDRGEIDRAMELYPSFIVHATHARREDFDSLRKRKIPVVFCPRANSLLGVGVPSIHLALEARVGFCFGTDNSTVCRPDMFEELSFAWACLRRADTKAGGEEAHELLRAATVEPSRIFDLPWGPVEENRPATFIVLSRRTNLENLTDVHSGLINRARTDNIRAVCVRGKIIKGVARR